MLFSILKLGAAAGDWHEVKFGINESRFSAGTAGTQGVGMGELTELSSCSSTGRQLTLQTFVG